MLRFNNVSAGYGSRLILQNVSFDIPAGKLVALIGPNGSGKTTLIRSASGVLGISAGSVKIAGKDLTSMSIQERARTIAVVPQARSLPTAFTAREVVALGRTPYLNWLGKLSWQDEVIIDQAMAQMDLMNLSDRSVTEISGGEQQRLFLARALSQESPLILMDEPTTHLDLQFQVGVMKHIHNLVHLQAESADQPIVKKTILAAIHDLNLVSRYADLVILLVDGKVENYGVPDEVMDARILSTAYNLSLRTIRDTHTGHVLVIPADENTEI